MQIDERQIRQLMQVEKPVTVRCYGVKELTFPAYVLMMASGILLALVLLVLANEILAPRTQLGFEVHQFLEPWMLKVALWTPPCLLLAIAIEVIEGAIVIQAFRKKFAARWKQAHEQYETLHSADA